MRRGFIFTSLVSKHMGGVILSCGQNYPSAAAGGRGSSEGRPTACPRSAAPYGSAFAFGVPKVLRRQRREQKKIHSPSRKINILLFHYFLILLLLYSENGLFAVYAPFLCVGRFVHGVYSRQSKSVCHNKL